MAEEAASLPFEAFGDLIQGRRSEQQDCLRAVEVALGGGKPGLLLVVADGMGGHAGGSVASALAVSTFIAAFEDAAGDSVPVRLSNALERANAALGIEVAARSELRGMGCTLVAALQSGRHLHWISVGDTLLLEITGDRVRRLNADHSLAPLLDAQAARGEISREEARTSEQRHMLRSALTGGRIALIDEGETLLSGGALLLAATDGLHTLDEDAIGSLAAASSGPQQLVAALLDAISADMPDDQDNTSLLAARVPGARTRDLWAPLPAGKVRSRRRWYLAGALLLLLALTGSLAALWWIWQDPPAAPSQPPTGKVR